MNRTYRVYSYTNLVTNQKYIGKTCMVSQATRAGHNGKKYRDCLAFWEAIEQYGWSSFEYSVIEDGLTEEEANIKEKEYIQKFNTLYPNGYNLQSGGSKGRKSHSITRERQSQVQSQITHTGMAGYHWFTNGKEEVCSIVCPSGYVEGRKPVSEEIRDRMSKSTKGRPAWNKGVGTVVQQFTKDGQFVAEYSSITEAEVSLGIKQGSSHIGRCLKGERATDHGYCWKAI